MANLLTSWQRYDEQYVKTLIVTDADYVVASDYAVGDKRIEVYPVKDITNLV